MANENQTLTVVIKEEGGPPSRDLVPSGAQPPPSSIGPLKPPSSTDLGEPSSSKSLPAPSPAQGPSSNIVEGRVIRRSILPSPGRGRGGPSSGGGGSGIPPPRKGGPGLPAPKGGGVPAVTKAVGGLFGTLGKLVLRFSGPIGIALTALSAGLVLNYFAFKALTKVVKAVDSMLGDLAETGSAFSADIAVAQANRDINEILARINQAGELGDDLSGYTGAKSELDQALIGLETAVTKLFAPGMTEGVKLLADVIFAATQVVELLEPLGRVELYITAFGAWFKHQFGETAHWALKYFLGALREQMERQADVSDDMDIRSQINDFLTQPSTNLHGAGSTAGVRPAGQESWRGGAGRGVFG